MKFIKFMKKEFGELANRVIPGAIEAHCVLLHRRRFNGRSIAARGSLPRRREETDSLIVSVHAAAAHFDADSLILHAT